MNRSSTAAWRAIKNEELNKLTYLLVFTLSGSLHGVKTSVFVEEEGCSLYLLQIPFSSTLNILF